MSVRKLMLALTATLALGFAADAMAQSNPGLGSSWPNTPDVSANPNYHVYRWQQGSITYVQVNDLNGNVKFAVGSIPGTIFVLPVGAPANVQVAQPVSTTSAMSSSIGTTLYQDSTISVQQAPQGFTVQSAAVCKDPADCSG